MKILMVMAHPDDEVIFGWPIFQKADAKKTLLMCSSDLNNPERQWCSHRKFVLEEVCEINHTKLTCLDNPSEFYRSSTRDEKLSQVQDEIVKNMLSEDYDYVFTHNPLGEYGHLDHKFVFETVLHNSRFPILFTDICMQSNWPSVSSIPDKIKNIYYKQHVSSCVLDKALYANYQEKYEKAGVWTWSEPEVDKCNLYLL